MIGPGVTSKTRHFYRVNLALRKLAFPVDEVVYERNCVKKRCMGLFGLVGKQVAFCDFNCAREALQGFGVSLKWLHQNSSSGQDGEASTGEVATPPCHDTLTAGPR